MILGLFRRGRARLRTIEALHLQISAAARAPGLYTRLGIPDTVEGRFESLCLHAIVVLRALKSLPPPADDVAQDLVNALFSQFDASLRESGVGDLGVSKRMKKLGASFYARATGCGDALDGNDRAALERLLARNVLGREDASADRLAAYVSAAASRLEALDLDALLRGALAFPDPETYADEARADEARADEAR